MSPKTFGFVPGGPGRYLDPWGRYSLAKRTRKVGRKGSKVDGTRVLHFWQVTDTMAKDCFDRFVVVADRTLLADTCRVFARYLIGLNGPEDTK